MSKKSEMIKAVKLAAAMRADKPKIVSYAFSFGKNLIDGGSATAKSENNNIPTMTTMAERTTLRARSFPNTSVITSLIVKIRGKVKIATLALSGNDPMFMI